MTTTSEAIVRARYLMQRAANLRARYRAVPARLARLERQCARAIQAGTSEATSGATSGATGEVPVSLSRELLEKLRGPMGDR